MTFGLRHFLLLLAAIASVAARQSHSAFIAPVRKQTCRNVEECSSDSFSSRTRGVKHSRVKGIKGVKLAAVAKAGGSKKKKKKSAAKPEVDNFKKSEFVASIAEKTGFTRAESEEALTAVLQTIAEVSSMTHESATTMTKLSN